MDKIKIGKYCGKGVVSFIVPVYNAEKYLSRCIESLINQSYREIEIILVNDCSSDKSAAICDQYAEKDKRVRVIHKNVNQGVSKARNEGITLANGELITFVDSDDYVSVLMAEDIVNNMTDQVDMVVYGKRVVTMDSKVLFEERYADTKSSGLEIGKTLNNINMAYMYAKVYRKSILDISPIRFDENASMGEDSIFVKEYICHINKELITSSKCFYFYVRENNQSLSNKYYDNLEYVYGRIWKQSELLSKRYPEYILKGTKNTLIITMVIQNLYAKQSKLTFRKRVSVIKKYMDNDIDRLEMISLDGKGMQTVIRRICFKLKNPYLLDFIFFIAKQIKTLCYK
ncbi:glycosyltransferase family 2 protein [Tannockella kyphosi]|uniref:glycosyltransferase family 2 protein n=1 Tax=Tannockella kyphosi TaxID=2899121 RepID=UPI0020120FBC|nr:glycosyltransferase family 2 protein [Tannockella kyphosi]